jgi:hypothetical protein
MFEYVTTFADSVFYDASAWTMAAAYGMPFSAAPAAKVALNLHDEDDEDDGIPFSGSTKRAPTPVSAPTRRAAAKFEDDDELNRLTNEILGD